MIATRSGFKHWLQNSPLYIRKEMTGLYKELRLQGQNANLSATTLFLPEQSGLRRISGMQIVTTADGTSSVMPSATIGWTDADSGVAQTAVLLATQNGNTTGTKVSGEIIINPKSGVAVTVTGASYASNTGGAMKYSMYVAVEAL